MNTAALDPLLDTMDVTVNAVAICEVRRGVRLVGKPENAVVLHQVLAGTLHLELEGSGPVICKPGCIIVVPPNTGLRMAAGAAKTDITAADHCRMVRDGLLLVDAAGGKPGDVRVACGLVMPDSAGSFGPLGNLKKTVIAELGDMEFVRTASALMLLEIAEPALGTRALLGSLMKACLIPLIRRHLAQAGQQPALLMHNPRLGKAVSAILGFPAANHSVAALARLAGMSRSAFAKQFTAAFGYTPMEFVCKTRLHHAAELLRTTDIAVKVIASSTGFASRSHFSRAFRDAYGADPSAFRAARFKA